MKWVSLACAFLVLLFATSCQQPTPQPTPTTRPTPVPCEEKVKLDCKNKADAARKAALDAAAAAMEACRAEQNAKLQACEDQNQSRNDCRDAARTARDAREEECRKIAEAECVLESYHIKDTTSTTSCLLDNLFRSIECSDRSDDLYWEALDACGIRVSCESQPCPRPTITAISVEECIQQTCASSPASIAAARREVIQAIVESRRNGYGEQTFLRQEYLQAQLDAASSSGALEYQMNQAARSIIACEPDERALQAQKSAGNIVSLLERQFILDPNASSLDLLPPEQQERYRDFEWHELDFPGINPGEATKGPNEARADRMNEDLKALYPERRANSQTYAVVTKEEAKNTPAVMDFIRNNVETIPDHSPKRQLYREAWLSFQDMRDAARDDGVTLTAGSAFRHTSTATDKSNPVGHASFSSHMLGLAVDLEMDYTEKDGTVHTFRESPSQPFQILIEMRNSPVHKWMFLHGAEYGWYPFHHEPWHWEYNPPAKNNPTDFRDRFWEAFRESQTQ